MSTTARITAPRDTGNSDTGRTRRWLALAVLSASLLLITMDMTILNIALPDMAAELRPTANQQLWIVDVYSLVLAGLLVPWAAVADRWGRRRMLLLGIDAIDLTLERGAEIDAFRTRDRALRPWAYLHAP